MWLNNQPTNKGWWKVLDVKFPGGYEVLRAEHISNSGSHGISFIYRNDHNDHLTVQADLVPMVKLWLKERKQNG